MALNANNSKNGANGPSVPPLAPGTYPARVVQIIDMGLQPQRPYKGQEKEPAYSVRIVYELVDEFLLDEEGNEDKEKPRWIGEEMPLYSLNAERAKSTLRYNALDPNGDLEGDFSKLIGIPCIITIVQNQSEKTKRIYNNVSNVAPLMRGMEIKPLVNEPTVFDLDNPSVESWKRFPEWLQERIKGNLEYKGSPLEKLVEENPSSPAEEEENQDAPW